MEAPELFSGSMSPSFALGSLLTGICHGGASGFHNCHPTPAPAGPDPIGFSLLCIHWQPADQQVGRVAPPVDTNHIHVTVRSKAQLGKLVPYL
jgi:hypothetical protein